MLGGAVRRHEGPLLLGAAAAIFALAALLPLAALLTELRTTSVAAVAVLGTWRPWALLLRSTILSALVTLVAVVLGVPLGLLVARTNLHGRRALWVLHALPLFLPPFVVALGWFQIFGREGFLGNETTARLLFGPFGMIAVLALTFAPVVTSLVVLGVLGVDASLEEAARLVARPWRVVRRILVPAAGPSIVLSAIVVFALTLSELGVPMFLRVEVFPAAVFARLGGIDYAPGEAFILALPLVPLALLLLHLERRYVGPRSFAVAGLRGTSRDPLPLRRWRLPITGAAWLIAGLSVAPLLALGARSMVGGTLATLPRWIGRAPWTSLLAGSLAATVIGGLGLVLGHAAARRLPGATFLDALAMLVFVMPASVLGVGLIAVWNRAPTQVVYGSIAILVIGFVARYTVVGVRAVASVVLQSPIHLEEAAAACGAGAGRRLVRIVFPVNARGVLFGWVLALVFCLRDLETAVLFYPAGREPLTVRLFTLEANGPPGVVAGLCVIQVAITLGALCIAALPSLRTRTA